MSNREAFEMRCRTSQDTCVRGQPKVKFGRVFGPSKFAQDQIWVATPSRNALLRFVNETEDTIANYLNTDNDNEPNGTVVEQNPRGTAPDLAFVVNASRLSTPTVNVPASICGNLAASDGISDNSSGVAIRADTGTIYSVTNQSFPIAIPAASTITTSPSETGNSGDTPLEQQSYFHPRESDAFLQAVLVRYYTENLAHWFDLNDPLRHFTMTVPLRSRQSRPLLNAILTASARQLTRARKHRNEAGVIEWQGNVLPQLNEEMAMYFQNGCIRELLDLSSDSTHVMSADLLAAAVILRTDEEMDTLFRGDGPDDQIFLNVAHAYIDAQVSTVASPAVYSAYGASPDTSNSMHETRRPPERITTPEISNLPIIDESYRPQSRSHSGRVESSAGDDASRSLRQACFWAACRQDVHASFLKQRPINFPLPYCNAQRSLAPAQDHIWTIRTIVFCADVLEYCYGRRSSRHEVAPAYTNIQRWQTLKQRHSDITVCLPDSFQPTFFCESNIADGDVFPQIWFQDPCYATGIGHLELARILLTVFDPSISRLGLGNVASQRERSKTLKCIVLRLCGIASSNRNTPPNFINAFTSILLCGEYFTDPREHAAILHLLESMRFDFAYYTKRVADKLSHAWQQNLGGDKCDEHHLWSPNYR